MVKAKQMVMLSVMMLISTSTHACDQQMDEPVASITVANAWSRPTGRRTMSGVMYLTITNHSDSSDTLLGVQSDIAETAMLHATTRDGDVTGMEHIGRLTIVSGETISLTPGGYHIMLMTLSGPIKKGDTVPITLTFEKAGPVATKAVVSMSAPTD